MLVLSATYEQARKKLERSQYTSELSSDSERPQGKRKRRPPPQWSQSDEESVRHKPTKAAPRKVPAVPADFPQGDLLKIASCLVLHKTALKNLLQPMQCRTLLSQACSLLHQRREAVLQEDKVSELPHAWLTCGSYRGITVMLHTAPLLLASGLAVVVFTIIPSARLQEVLFQVLSSSSGTHHDLLTLP